MEWAITFIVCTAVGVLLARGRALWLHVVAVGACLGIGFAFVERDPTYLVATVVLGLVFAASIRRSTDDPGAATG